jgi:hypothetical protein
MEAVDVRGRVEAATRFGAACLPRCGWHDRLVEPARECGPDCPGQDPADPPAVDREAARAAGQPWRADADGPARRQAGLDRFTGDDG